MKFILFIYLKTSRMKVNWKRVALYVLRIIEMVITGAAGGAITQLSSLTRGHGLCASAPQLVDGRWRGRDLSLEFL